MTIQNPPIFIQAGSHPAEDVRRWMSAMVDGTAGVVAAGDLAVTENGTPNMSVDVAGGRGFVAGDEATYQGMYAFENRGITNVAIAASDPTNPRIDLIVVRIRDAAYSGATNTVAIEVVTGTPAAVPADPAVPANCLLLAHVAVAALATSVTNANITDNRTRAYSLGVSSTMTDISNITGGEDPSNYGWTALPLSSGYVASPTSYIAGLWIKRGPDNVAHIVGSVQRTGGTVAAGAPTLVTSSVPASLTPSFTVFGVSINQTSSAVIPSDLRSDNGIRLYGPISNSDRLHIATTYPIAQPS